MNNKTTKNRTIHEFLKRLRNAIEAYWDETTVSPKFLPIDIAKPQSLGQCAPTSQVLLDELREAFPNSDFTLAIGEVRKSGALVIPYHVWVVELTESPKDSRIIDITADQSEVLPVVVYDSVRELAKKSIQYITYEQSHEKRFVHAEALRRYETLRGKYKQHSSKQDASGFVGV